MARENASGKRSSRRHIAVAIVLLLFLTAAGIECYREWRNYERTAKYEYDNYVMGVFLLYVAWDTWGESASESPVDFQAMVDDLGLIPPPNPYRSDHKTILTTIDKRIPGAVYYIPGPIEMPSTFANGLFLNKQTAGPDFINDGDAPWVIGWSLSKPDGIPDGLIQGLGYGIIDYGDKGPLKRSSWFWTHRWAGKFYWKYPDGTIVEPEEERFISMFEDYYRRHPENFAAEKRPRMPKGFKITNEDAERAYLPDEVRSYYKKLYGYDPVVGDAKGKE